VGTTDEMAAGRGRWPLPAVLAMLARILHLFPAADADSLAVTGRTPLAPNSAGRSPAQGPSLAPDRSDSQWFDFSVRMPDISPARFIGLVFAVIPACWARRLPPDKLNVPTTTPSRVATRGIITP